LITPLFGGGVDPQQADPVTFVRGTEVRGHLRFWWRATRGGEYSTVEKLREREATIWGNTELHSPVSIRVFNWAGGTPEVAFRVGYVNGKKRTIASKHISPYAAFPLLPDKDEQKRAGWESEKVLLNVEFSLELRYPSTLASEVDSALWAWENLGGIGARTRRGFGAISVIEGAADIYPDNSADIEKIVRGKLAAPFANGKSVTALSTDNAEMPFVVTRVHNSSLSAWTWLVDRLNRFRQMRYENRYGLSQWPEANEIRRLHNLEPKLPEGAGTERLVRKFPRAAFGLPIGFHMPHDNNVPDNIVLQGTYKSDSSGTESTYDRLASRLLLRPMACGNGKAVGLALVLNAPSEPPGGLMLKNAPKNPIVASDLNEDEARQIEPLDGNPDVLQAFLDYLR